MGNAASQTGPDSGSSQVGQATALSETPRMRQCSSSQPPLDIIPSTRYSDDLLAPMLSHEGSYPRKRHREQSACNDIEQQARVKRTKTISHNYSPEFWDALSKITLTRKALAEFERRTTEENIERVVSSARRTTRLLRSDAKRLREFATKGGPDLSHLRGVSICTETLHE